MSAIICFCNDNYLGDFRLYDIPDSTFESEEETDESEEGRFIVGSLYNRYCVGRHTQRVHVFNNNELLDWAEYAGVGYWYYGIKGRIL